MTTPEDRLATLADLVAESAGARLAKLLREIAALERRIHALRSTPTDGAAEDGFLQAGGGRLWQEWRMQQIARFNAELARLRAREPALREDAGRASVRARLIAGMAKRRA